ncbi:MAG: DUF3826 domain-containing protein [Prevotella sp.]|nr:DUF3826 domain-containing protein [Prevotella sp.]
MRSILLFIALFSISSSIFAQESDAEYTKVLSLRADKIVKALDIKDPSVYDSVANVIVIQYKNLGKIHDSLDNRIKYIKKNITDKTEQERSIKNLKNEASTKLYDLHCAYIGDLSTYLTNDQVAKVKDGMTYGVVKVTYDSYLDMIPSLENIEKDQLYAWLVEAREHAMSAASSKEKHEWFGKYKGRFNNYLSKRGYDIQKERKNWEERLKQKEK